MPLGLFCQLDADRCAGLAILSVCPNEDSLRATEEARSRGVEVLEEIGTVVLDDSIPNHEVRQYIFKLLPIDDVSRLVEGCRNLRAGGDGSLLALIHHWYGYTRKYSPALLEKTPLQFAEDSPLGRAVVFLKDLNAGGGLLMICRTNSRA